MQDGLDRFLERQRAERLRTLREFLTRFAADHGTTSSRKKAVRQCAEAVDGAFCEYLRELISVDLDRTGQAIFRDPDTGCERTLQEYETDLRSRLSALHVEYKGRVGRARTAQERQAARRWYQRECSSYRLEADVFALRTDDRFNARDKVLMGIGGDAPGVSRNWYRRSAAAMAQLCIEVLNAAGDFCRAHKIRITRVDLYPIFIATPWISTYKPVALALRAELFIDGADVLDGDVAATDGDYRKVIDRTIRQYLDWLSESAST